MLHNEYLFVNIFDRPPKDFMENLPLDFSEKCIESLKDVDYNEEFIQFLEDLYLNHFRKYLNDIFRNFWPQFCFDVEDDKKNSNGHHRHVFSIIEKLNSKFCKWFENSFLDVLYSPDRNMNMSIVISHRHALFIEKLKQILYSTMIAEMPLTFNNFVLNTFSFSFKVFEFLNSKNRKDVNDSIEVSCLGCEYPNDSNENDCYCISMRIGFIHFRNSLRNLGLFDRLCMDIIRSVVFTSIEKYIFDLCEDLNFSSSCLCMTFNWFENNLTNWCQMVYLSEANEEQSEIEAFFNLNNDRNVNCNNTGGLRYYMSQNNVMNRLQIPSLSYSNIRDFIVNTFIYCRMSQLFDIIIDFPNSEPAVYDLHVCIISEPFYRKKFITTLKSSIEKRLLHPGVPTSDIIDAYITHIKALKVLDPQGIILQIVCDPIRNYLKSREDTVRCIINSLTSDNLIDLSENSEIVGNIEMKDEDEIVLDTWTAWQPQPIGVSKLNQALLNSDIISLLVNIFDSKDLFVQEYQRLLSQRILLSFEMNLEMEHRNLELLSLRFGECELHNCEVMLKDVKDSGRVNQRISSGEVGNMKSIPFETNALILSKQFWPENFGIQTSDDSKSLKLPEEVDKAFKSYTKGFETIKANRTLDWIHQLGVVKLELELNNGTKTVEYTMRPIHAAIIFQFQERKLWRISELAEALNILPSAIRRHISYWQGHGLLTEVSLDTFLLDEDGKNNSTQSNKSINIGSSQDLDNFDGDIHEEENQSVPTEVANENRLQIFWNFIDNMLKNLHSLSLDRIFLMLKMFNMQSPEIESLNVHELRQFLDLKVSESKLAYSNGLYSLKSEPNSP